MVLKFLATKGLGLLGKGKKFIKTDPKIIIKPAKDPDVIKLNKQIGVAKKIGAGTGVAIGAIGGSVVVGAMKKDKKDKK
jgi:hypothetical protein